MYWSESGQEFVFASTDSTHDAIKVVKKDLQNVRAKKIIADAVEIILDEIKEDPTLSQRCRVQAERFPWSATIRRLDTLHPEKVA